MSVTRPPKFQRIPAGAYTFEIVRVEAQLDEHDELKKLKDFGFTMEQIKEKEGVIEVTSLKVKLVLTSEDGETIQTTTRLFPIVPNPKKLNQLFDFRDACGFVTAEGQSANVDDPDEYEGKTGRVNVKDYRIPSSGELVSVFNWVAPAETSEDAPF